MAVTSLRAVVRAERNSPVRSVSKREPHCLGGRSVPLLCRWRSLLSRSLLVCNREDVERRLLNSSNGIGAPTRPGSTRPAGSVAPSRSEAVQTEGEPKKWEGIRRTGAASEGLPMAWGKAVGSVIRVGSEFTVEQWRSIHNNGKMVEGGAVAPHCLIDQLIKAVLTVKSSSCWLRKESA